ncbi:hypothetical protein DFQ28_002937 [Apophysomyces sp. BC1034]|nr:hypothetical protein DFQ30_009685 [Apophysomyces sp. BC1015]KAG0180663.1 hypothetical protein DFQ29_000223 [Apophysomyces sp. BC1021]KAG0194862.1 hypothetical protein DFQ28_002937 [Apophysomyces sp. BC1034]
MALSPPVETKYHGVATHLMATHRRSQPFSSQRSIVSDHRFSLPYARNGFFSKYDRKWRWWHYLSFLILLLALIEATLLLIGFIVLLEQMSPVRIALRQYPSVPYHHLDTSTSPTLESGTTVYHVTKEFGPATMGGMGTVVTALATAQQRSGLLDVSVVMPYYSYLRNKFNIEKVVDLVIDVRDKNGKMVPVEFRISRMMYVFNPSVNVTEATDGGNLTATAPPVVLRTEQVPVYLIGPGNRKPFTVAFRASNPVQVYSAAKGLPHEWRDQYFVKAAAAFLSHQAASADEESLFAPVRLGPHVDVIHLHGATNAQISSYIRDNQRVRQLGPKPPAIVYTMHDYLDELQYTYTTNNVKRFFSDDMLQTIQPYVHGQRIFLSRMGIDLADVVTFVSHSMAVDIIEGRMDFYLKELVMDSLLRKAEARQFFGISNGVDFSKLSPFVSKRLGTKKMGFSNYALERVKEIQQQQQQASSGAVPSDRTVWHLSEKSDDYVSTAKDRAKRYLVRRKLLTEEDLKRPVVLYVGRFQYNKGLEMFDEAAQHFVKNNMKFVIMGQPNNYPLRWVEALQERYGNHVVVMSTPADQRRWLVFYRAAADFIFVPSLTESFGLVAVEGLVFGAPVISTGVGGLKEFLIDRPPAAGNWTEPVRRIHITRHKQTHVPTVTSREVYNAYLFNPKTLGDAIRDAAIDYRRNTLSKALKEEFSLRMIQSALELGWDRDNQQGPMYDYNRVYEIALANRRIPAISQHEIEEERRLIQRLS